MTVTMSREVTSFSDLGRDMWEYLTGKDAAINDHLVADTLAARGATVHVDGPRWSPRDAGPDAHSAAFGSLAGSRHLARGWRVLASSVVEAIRDRRRLFVMITATVIASVVAVRAT